MAKHSKDQETKVIRLEDYQKEGQGPSIEAPVAEVEYGEDGEEQASREYAQKREQRQVPKAVYRISLVLLAVILGLSLWMNREYLTWDNMKEWARLQLKGPDSGDGYPVQITGTDVSLENFISYNGAAVMLSNTSLTVVNGDGKEELSVRHNLNQPVLRTAGGRYLLFNRGSTGYQVVSGGRTVVEGNSGEDLIAGSLAANGKFALGMEGAHGASKLEVYMADGSLQYEYPFANDYITSIALNYDGSFGAVCTVRSEKGAMVSQLTVFDFTQTMPVAQYETWENFLWGAYWGDNGVIYGVGDASMLSARSSDYQFTEYSYQGRSLTAYAFSAGRAFLSISAYEHAGASMLLVFRGDEAYGENNPVRAEMDKRIEDISISGGTVGLLSGGQVVFCDYSTGMELGRADAGTDAKGISLSSERRAYVLGVSEVRTVEIE